MAISKAQINWTGVAHGSTGITRVTSAMFGQGGSLIKFKGDTDIYPSIIAAVTIEPHASITTADIGTLMGIGPGTVATLSATLSDALKVSGGAVVFAMANAVMENVDSTGEHAQFANAIGTFQAGATDGVTNPLSLSRT
jgi:hypothetical protein